MVCYLELLLYSWNMLRGYRLRHVAVLLPKPEVGAVEPVHELLDLSHVVVDDLQGDGPIQIPIVLLLQLRHHSHQCQQQTIKLPGLFREIAVCSASTAASVYVDIQCESNIKDIYRKRLD